MAKKSYIYLNKLSQDTPLFFNARNISLIAGLSVASVSALVAFVFLHASAEMLLGIWVSTFLGCVIAVFLCLELLVFNEINKLYVLLERLKKRDYKLVRKSIKGLTGGPLKKLNRELYTFTRSKEQEIDHLKEAEIYRREFLADISHELKTPIFSAQGFIYTLLDGAIEEPELAMKFLKKAAKSLDGLNGLVNDLITLSQMENGVISMHMEHYDLSAQVQEIMEMLENKAEKRNAVIKWDKKTDRNVWVYADRNRIAQVMINLIENAIKYGNENGEVTVSLEQEKDQILVAVRDDGPGIAGEHLKRIFERFYRIEKSRTREKGGSGLGLSIVKQIVEAHSSKISVASRVGKGTHFQFKLKQGDPSSQLQVSHLDAEQRAAS